MRETITDIFGVRTSKITQELNDSGTSWGSSRTVFIAEVKTKLFGYKHSIVNIYNYQKEVFTGKYLVEYKPNVSFMTVSSIHGFIVTSIDSLTQPKNIHSEMKRCVTPEGGAVWCGAIPGGGEEIHVIAGVTDTLGKMVETYRNFIHCKDYAYYRWVD